MSVAKIRQLVEDAETYGIEELAGKPSYVRAEDLREALKDVPEGMSGDGWVQRDLDVLHQAALLSVLRPEGTIAERGEVQEAYQRMRSLLIAARPEESQDDRLSRITAQMAEVMAGVADGIRKKALKDAADRLDDANYFHALTPIGQRSLYARWLREQT